ncbi:LamG-like jellyroll fold domain-containing protein [Luteolibacter marinus]|uniref:LamG-like jellyroll fold domain-containing protein n=1 Tax=Luteolibacter marinus TaxID=2776705 RepID=UPI00186640E6|nr:LamG-like jellyroll fold domain-containing protein [Luteolibacter marinus]
MKNIVAGLAGLILGQTAHAAVFAHYSFDSGFTDSSGNGRDGTLVDVGTTGNSAITSTAGDYAFGGGAMSFSSDRDYVDIPMATFSSGTPYTIAFWARKAAGDSGQSADFDMVIGDRSNSNFFIALNDVTGTGMRWRSSSSAAERQADFGVAKDYEWHHYAIVASGTTISLYYDGAFFGSDSGNQTGFQFNTIGEAYLGTSDFDFHGEIDEVWVFDEALGGTELSNLRDFNSTVPEPAAAVLSAIGVISLLRRRRGSN